METSKKKKRALNDVANKYEIPAKLAWEEKVYSALKPSISFFFFFLACGTFYLPQCCQACAADQSKQVPFYPKHCCLYPKTIIIHFFVLNLIACFFFGSTQSPIKLLLSIYQLIILSPTACVSKLYQVIHFIYFQLSIVFHLFTLLQMNSKQVLFSLSMLA